MANQRPDTKGKGRRREEGGAEPDEKVLAAERAARRERRRRREEARRRKRRRYLIRRAAVIGGVLVLILVIVLVAKSCGKNGKSNGVQEDQVTETPVQTDTPAEGGETAVAEDTVSAENRAILDEAEKLAAMYDYDAAMELLKPYAEEGSEPAFAEAISRFQATKDSCIAYDVETIPHFFFHSLLNDDRGFKAELVGDFVAKDNGCWMCSTNEFNTMLQQMYDHGCVLVTMRDMVIETKDDNGKVHFEPNDHLMLPPGKTPVVMSEDDLSYYHAYDDQGIAEKLVLDDEGKVKCVYTDESGTTHIGDYDVVPLLSTFIEEHPDFSYHNAHCIIALTGYNGVFGYRTDEVYKTREAERLDANQKEWLDAHPDFNWDEDVAEAKKIAEALKAEGYEFASHTWGHRHADTASVDSLIRDNERFVNWVVPIIGPVDTIIFAHGSDLQGASDYSYDNEKYAYFKSVGYNYYSNVDGSVPYWNQIRDEYVRTARINLDGYRLWQAMSGNSNSIADMEILGIHDIESFFDYARSTPVEIMG